MTQAKDLPANGPLRRWGKRLFWLVVVSLIIGWILRHSAEVVLRDDRPAGFGRGLVHGILMPIALPNLLFGNDVPIYATHNNGRLYKLGYTLGVNGCGALFFGFLYWRLLRLRKEVRADVA